MILLLAVLIIAAIGWWLYTPDENRAELEARYAAPPSQFIMVAGVRLHLRDTGPREAPAVILLHGFGSSLHTWDAWAKLLEPQYRVVRFDIPGFGLTGPDPTGDYADDRSHAVLVALMDQLGIQRATLVGHSMGGRIAWSFAAKHPERMARLVLIAPDGFASPDLSYNQTAKVPLMMRSLPFTLPDFMFRPNVELSYGDPKRLTDTNYNTYRDMMLAPGVRQAIVNRMAQMVLPDPVPLLKRITVPTLLLWGVTDQMIPPVNAKDYLAALPNAQLVTFPNLGHVCFEEAPEETVRPLLSFLATAP